MRLYLSEILHFSTSLAIFWLMIMIFPVAWPVLLVAALLGGFFIDADHMIDQIIVFGLDLDPGKLFKGASFFQSDKAYIFFHGWEYVPVLIALSFIFKMVGLDQNWQAFTLTLAFSMLGHLLVDSLHNEMSWKGYSVINRLRYGFNHKPFLSKTTWQKHLKDKEEVSASIKKNAS